MLQDETNLPNSKHFELLAQDIATFGFERRSVSKSIYQSIRTDSVFLLENVQDLALRSQYFALWPPISLFDIIPELDVNV
jgi:hypothetical protein